MATTRLTFRIAAVFVAFTVSVALGSVIKRPSVSLLAQVARIMAIYELENNGDLPGSWIDMKTSGYLPPEILEASRVHGTLERRYGFFPDQRLFVQVYPPERILVMAIQSSDEGNRYGPDGEEVEGRLLIVKTEKGGIHTAWHSEKQLERLFASEGLALEDYTGLEGNWLNGDELKLAEAGQATSDRRRDDTADESLEQQLRQPKKITERPHTSAEAGSGELPPGLQLRLLPGVVIVFLLAAIAFIWAKRRSPPIA